MRRYTVTILFRSGARESFECDSLDVEAYRDTGRLIGLSASNPSLKINFIDVGEIVFISTVSNV